MTAISIENIFLLLGSYRDAFFSYKGRMRCRSTFNLVNQTLMLHKGNVALNLCMELLRIHKISNIITISTKNIFLVNAN